MTQEGPTTPRKGGRVGSWTRSQPGRAAAAPRCLPHGQAHTDPLLVTLAGGKHKTEVALQGGGLHGPQDTVLPTLPPSPWPPGRTPEAGPSQTEAVRLRCGALRLSLNRLETGRTRRVQAARSGVLPPGAAERNRKQPLLPGASVTEHVLAKRADGWGRDRLDGPLCLKASRPEGACAVISRPCRSLGGTEALNPCSRGRRSLRASHLLTR